MKPTRLLLFGLLLSLTSSATARTWTSTAGTTLEAEWVSSSGNSVTLKEDGTGRILRLNVTDLSQADQDWLQEQLEAAPPVNLPEEIAALVESQGKLLLHDDFNREDSDEVDDLGENWETNSQSRAQGDKQNDLVDGELVMTISPRADHAISTKHHTSEPYQDAVVYLRMKLEEDGQLKLAYNDTQDKSVWAGHINGVTIAPDQLLLADEREGRFKMTFRDTRNTPEGKAAYEAALEETDRTFPLDLKAGEWHEVVTLHRGDTLTVFIDGDEVGQHTSPGFGHATKRQFVFAVPKLAVVDDLHLWKLTPEGS